MESYIQHDRPLPNILLEDPTKDAQEDQDACGHLEEGGGAAAVQVGEGHRGALVGVHWGTMEVAGPVAALAVRETASS